jgi:mannose/fructose/N-acetylgalactosamine-specific phosphotransferase system component IIB
VPLLLARVDDRLVHGQVAYGWCLKLRPNLVVIVSDLLRASPERADLYLCALPEGSEGRVVSVNEALAPSFRQEVDSKRTLLLFPGTEEPLRLLERGFALSELNLGGLHHAPGKREALPYVFLDDADRSRLQAIVARGVRVFAQDLPSNPDHPVEKLLGGTG